jgi:hypothetical protein
MYAHLHLHCTVLAAKLYEKVATNQACQCESCRYARDMRFSPVAVFPSSDDSGIVVRIIWDPNQTQDFDQGSIETESSACREKNHGELSPS